MITYDSTTLYDNDFAYEGGSIYTKTLTETLSFEEVRKNSLSKSIVDTFTLSDTKTKEVSKNIIDTFTVTDIFSRVVDFIRTLSETFSIGERFNRWLNGSATIWVERLNVSSLWTKRINAILYDTTELYDSTKSYDGQASYSNRTKPATSWGDRTKPTSSWDKRTKPTSNWINRLKP